MGSHYIKNLKTPIAIVGLGKSGLAAYALLKACDISNSDILLFDEKSVDAQVSNAAELVKLQPKTLVISPGVPLKQSWIKHLAEQGSHITSEISLAASLITTEKVIGVTGSVGKSTVTSLLGEGAKQIDPNCFVGGNLGKPFCNYALDVVNGKKRADWIILELSSYQLENCKNLSLCCSLITFLSSNHLERYPSLSDYYLTKINISKITTDTCFLNNASTDCVAYSSQIVSKKVLVSSENFPDQQIFLIGKHNRDNFALAASVGMHLGWPQVCLDSMAQYKGLAHRLEYGATLNGITFINDSKATAMDSVLVAVDACLENIKPNQNLYLLLGGKDKNLPWQDLAVLKMHNNIKPVFFGACGNLAKEKSGLQGEYFEKLGSAINYCQKRVVSGDVLLLSPGGTSLDGFKNFEERGDFFKTLVLSEFES